ncbi:hypothetical protein CsSME_00011290 [Camellia sinensis var. sinensis]
MKKIEFISFNTATTSLPLASLFPFLFEAWVNDDRRSQRRTSITIDGKLKPAANINGLSLSPVVLLRRFQLLFQPPISPSLSLSYFEHLSRDFSREQSSGDPANQSCTSSN